MENKKTVPEQFEEMVQTKHHIINAMRQRGELEQYRNYLKLYREQSKLSGDYGMRHFYEINQEPGWLNKREQEMESKMKEYLKMDNRMIPDPPNPNEISPLKVVENGHGFYIGREQYDANLEQSVPWNILTGDLGSHKKAVELLEKCKEFQEIIKPIPTGNLEVTARTLLERAEEDPYNEIKAALISDYLENVRQPEMEKQIDFDFER